MDAAMEKIWKAVKGLDQADVHSAALCHSIINLMVNQGIVTKEEVARQIEKSVAKVVLVHKQVIKAMQDQHSGVGGYTGRQTLQ